MRNFYKIILILFLFFAGATGVIAQGTEQTGGVTKVQETNLELVNSIGHKLLEANDLPAQIEFKVAEEDHVNAYANIKNEIYIYDGMIRAVDTEEELAAVIGHEVGHIVNKHTHKQTFLSLMLKPVKATVLYITDKLWLSKLVEYVGVFSLLKVSRSDEHEADITGVDLMVNAGYNPLAMISVLNKISKNHLDILSTHPSGDKRLVYLYDYINYNYPSYVEEIYPTESYKKFKVYMDEVIKQRKENPEKLEKVREEQKELQKERQKRLEDIKTSGSPWEYSFQMLAPALQNR